MLNRTAFLSQRLLSSQHIACTHTSLRRTTPQHSSRSLQARAAQMAEHPKERVDEKHQAPPYPKQDQDAPGEEHKMTPEPDFGYDDYQGTGKLKDHVALITGADSGIGRAIALAFAREGANIVNAYWNEHEDAKKVEEVVKEAGVDVLSIAGDLSEEAQCQKVIDQAVKKFGKISILVNNASYQGPQVEDFREIGRERLEFTFKTNIIAMISLCQKVVEHMPKGGAIINISSVQAYGPKPGILDYACTKGAIVSLTKGLAPVLMPKGIRVNAIAPGPVWTPLVVESFPEEAIKNMGKGKPMGRPAQPKEFGGPAVFLACEKDSSYVSGSVLGVTGGEPRVN